MTKILFYYSVLASLFITVSSVLTSHTIGPVIFATLFLPVTAYFIIEFFRQVRTGFDKGNPPKKAEIIIIGSIFLLLIGVSVRNIVKNKNSGVSDTQNVQEPSPSPLIFKTSEESVKTMIEIKITDGSASVNVRSKPTVYSEKLGEAKNGESYEMISKDSGWYKIKFNESEGYVSSKYVLEK